MSILTSLLADLPRPIAHIVHIGAGPGGDLAAYLEACDGAILMVEAAAEPAAQLSAKAAGTPRVEVIRAAVSGDPQPRPFYEMNFPDLNSLAAPAGLKKVFPGLRVLSEQTVTPVSPAALLQDRLDPDRAGSNLLVIEAPGETLGILEALHDAGRLQAFGAICLQEGIEPLYDGAAPVAEIEGFLDRAGFRTRIEPAPQDPDRPYLAARLDLAAREQRQKLDRLGAALAEKEAALAEKETVIGDITQKLERARAELGDLRTALEAAKSRCAGLAKETETLEAERDTLRDTLEGLQGQSAEAQSEHDHRLRQSREEMLKAEGQIRLLRDLLLNGPDL